MGLVGRMKNAKENVNDSEIDASMENVVEAPSTKLMCFWWDRLKVS